MIRSRVLLPSCTTIEMGAQAQQHVLEEEEDDAAAAAAVAAALCRAAATSQAESGREVI